MSVETLDRKMKEEKVLKIMSNAFEIKNVIIIYVRPFLKFHQISIWSSV